MDDIKQKDNKKIFSTAETIVLVMVALIIGLLIGSLLNNKATIVKKEANDEYIKKFIDNYQYIIDNYYEEVDKEDLINNAISGMMESLEDPYSVYINEEESDNFSITLNGSYEGIGVQITKLYEDDYILVTMVFEDSPAQNAGLQAGDKIISIDGIDSKTMTASDFSNIVRSQEKSKYNLKVLRNEETIDITINKNVITLSSVSSKTYDIGDKKVGYIYIGIFANNTASQFKENLDKLEKEKIDYLILDVRSNSGGHLTSVDSILDMFLNSKQVMYQFEQNSKVTKIYGKGNDNKRYEIILLGDELSASASEVLISGLKENLGSIFIGKKTYGKGTVQELVTLSDGTQYKITVKKWLTPKGNWINSTEGIVPDIEVDLDEKYYTTYSEEDDTQLQYILEYISKK